jgi:hypothetical protein
LGIVHEYDEHSYTLVDVEYDSAVDIVFAAGQNGSFVADGPLGGNPAEITMFDAGSDVIISMGVGNTITSDHVCGGQVAAVYVRADSAYTGDLDTRHDLLWIGDGEQRTGSSICVFVEEPTQTAQRTTVAPETDPTPTPEPDSRTTPTNASTNDPGFSSSSPYSPSRG